MFYRRWVSEDVMKLLRSKGALHFLVRIALHGELPRYPGIRLDLQLRNEEGAKEVLSLYAGKTAILNVAFKPGGVIEFKAAGSYGRQPCADVLRRYTLGKLPDSLEADVLRYLNEVRIGSQWISKEGKLQNDLARRFSIGSLPADKFVIFDTEPNVGGRDGQVVLEKIQQFFRGHLADLALKTGSNFYLSDEFSSMGREADFFAIGLDNTLFIIEIKHFGASAGEIYFLPRQIGVYGSLWSHCAPGLIDDINRLVAQKEELGLIPPGSSGRRLQNEGLKIVPIVILGGQDSAHVPSAEVRARYVKIREHLSGQRFPETGKQPLGGLLEFASTRREACQLESLGW